MNLSCTESGLYAKCGKEFSPLGHDRKEATCTEPKTCLPCELNEGEALGHDLREPEKENKKALRLVLTVMNWRHAEYIWKRFRLMMTERVYALMLSFIMFNQES